MLSQSEYLKLWAFSQEGQHPNLLLEDFVSLVVTSGVQLLQTVWGETRSLQTAVGETRSLQAAWGETGSLQTAWGEMKSLQTAVGETKSLQTAWREMRLLPCEMSTTNPGKS